MLAIEAPPPPIFSSRRPEFLPFLSPYILLLLCLYCQPSHLPIAPRPSRVLTLGFIQICSLQGWKVVMRAKKNSLTLNPTTELVFLTKPNENSIFSPCYSLPSTIFTSRFMPPLPPSALAPLHQCLISSYLSKLTLNFKKHFKHFTAIVETEFKCCLNGA